MRVPLFIVFVFIVGFLYAQKECPVGTFITANKTSDFVCEDCPVGFYSDKKNSRSCEPCAPGTFAASPKQSACKPCEKGHYAPISAASSCIACPLHTIGSTQGLKACSECPAESFTTSKGAVACAQCPAGTEHSKTVRGACIPCAFGFYNEKEGSRCKKCAAGQSTAKVGATQCILCKPGSIEVNGECVKCAEGTYNVKFGAQKCEPCPANFVSSSSRTTCVDTKDNTVVQDEAEETASSCSTTYNAIVFVMFLLVTAFGLSQLDEIMQDQASHMKLGLLILVLMLGKLLGDGDGWLLAYSAVFRVGEVPSWYGVVANTAAIRLGAGVLVSFMYGSWLVLAVEAVWFGLVYVGNKNDKTGAFPATQHH